MKRTLSVLVFAFLAAVLYIVPLTPAPAHAVLITLEPDDYPVGTNVSNLFEGVTITRFTSLYSTSATSSPVYVEEGGYLPATGVRTFGQFWNPSEEASNCWNSGVCYPGYYFSAMVVEFDRPTNYFEMTASWGVDQPVFSVCGTDNLCTGSWPTPTTYLRPIEIGPGPAAIFQFGSFDHAPFIQTVVIGGWSAQANLDRIRYNSVPEPSSLLLLSMGLVGLAWWGRKQMV